MVFPVLHSSDSLLLPIPIPLIPASFCFTLPFLYPLPRPSEKTKQTLHPVQHVCVAKDVCVCMRAKVWTVEWGAKSLLSSRKDGVSSHSEGGESKGELGSFGFSFLCVYKCVWVEEPKSLWLMWVCNPVTQPPFPFTLSAPTVQMAGEKNKSWEGEERFGIPLQDTG